MLHGIGIWELLAVLAIVIVIFGTKRLANVGGDVGKAIKSFKKAMGDDEETPSEKRDADFDSDEREAASRTSADTRR